MALVLALTACEDKPTAPLFPNRGVSSVQGAEGTVIPGRYLITLRNNVVQLDTVVAGLARTHGAVVRSVWRHALKGFSASMSDSAAALLAKNPQVALVEPDRIGTVVGTQPSPPNWGLDRSDQRNLPLDNSYTYLYSGSGVRIYILDTGIRMTHTDFGGRAHTGVDIVTPGGTADDCYGHGTHVAGIAASATYGIAKSADLYAVRILDCFGNGTAGQAISGVDWVTGQKNANPSWRMVANMSVRYGYVQTLNNAVENSISAGVTYVVAAANNSTDACTDSPASAPDAITVAASDQFDGFASFSNRGSCVDLIAPGVDILSTYNTSDNATATLSGTSMAAPHVAGAAALYYEQDPSVGPAGIAYALTNNATADVVAGVPAGTPNLLLFVNALKVSLSGPTIVDTPGNVTVNSTLSGPSGSYFYVWTFKWCRAGSAPGDCDATSQTTQSGWGMTSLTKFIYSDDKYVDFIVNVYQTPGGRSLTTDSHHIVGPFAGGCGSIC